MARVDLVFASAPLTGLPLSLVFGETDTPPLVDAWLDLHATLPALTGAVPVALAIPVALQARLPALGGTVALAYDNRLVRYRQAGAAAAQQVARSHRPDCAGAWGTSRPARPVAAPRWAAAAPARPMAMLGLGSAGPRQVQGLAAWRLGMQRSDAAASGHQVAHMRRQAAVVVWQLARALQRQSTDGLQAGAPVRCVVERAEWMTAQYLERLHLGRSGASGSRHGRPAEVARWQHARRPPAGAHPATVPPPGQPCYLPDPHLVYSEAWSAGPHLVFLCGWATERPALITIPVRRAYVTINHIEMLRIDGNIELPAHTFGLSVDVDSWTWSWSATLDAAALASLQPGAAGDPVEVEAKVNGVPYRLLVESVSRSRQFGQARLNVRGRGTAAVLDAPYAPALSFTNQDARTALQLMADALTVNGVSLGWALDWQLTDWLVPAGAWSHQGSYISAVKAIAEAAGGYLQPHATAQTLRVLPRYPQAPWAWGAVTPDIELPADVTEVEGIEWVTKPAYDRVYVSGIGQGVLGQVTRAGTAGALVAPMVTDALVTHADAARQRGLAILAETGRQAMVSLKLPVLPETGLILPGQYLRRTDGADSLFGLVRSTSVEWGYPKLRQTLGVETHA